MAWKLVLVRVGVARRATDSKTIQGVTIQADVRHEIAARDDVAGHVLAHMRAGVGVVACSAEHRINVCDARTISQMLSVLVHATV
jgi:hypothetical protein